MKSQVPAYLRSPGAFIGHYLVRWKLSFTALGVLVVSAAACGVGAQYQMKFLVDAMAGPRHSSSAVWSILVIFIGLIAAESALWRFCGWLTCRSTIGVGVQMRLDLFQHLNGQSIRYFMENLAGSLGQRLTAVAGAFGALTNTMVWRLTTPLVDFLGGILIFATIDWHMAAVMGVYVVSVTGALIRIGQAGRRLHSTYFDKASEVAGELIDVISNMWAVKAFSTRRRESERLQRSFEHEAEAQTRSWMYTERTRAFYDLVLWIMATMMLLWAIFAWSRQRISPGDVVVITTLTFRILHGSRELALAYADAVQQIGYMDETLRVIGQVHGIVDPADAPIAVPDQAPLSSARCPSHMKTARRC